MHPCFVIFMLVYTIKKMAFVCVCANQSIKHYNMAGENNNRIWMF